MELVDRFLFIAHGHRYFGAGRTHVPVTDDNLRQLISGLTKLRFDIKEPCGECHLKPGEFCDICGITALLT